MKTLIILFVMAVCLLQYKLWFGGGSFREWRDIQSKIQLQAEVNQQLKAKNSGLVADIEELRHADQALEENARQNLGMVKEDEVYFQVIAPSKKP